MKVVLWMVSGSCLRVDGWGPRKVEDLSASEYVFAEKCKAMLDELPGGFGVFVRLDRDDKPIGPIAVPMHHIMSVQPIADQ